MEVIRSALSRGLNVISAMGIADILDILIVAYIIYRVIMFVRLTNSYNLAKGVLVLLVALLLSYVFDLRMIYFLLSHAVEIGLLALVVLFQPELRRLLERMGRSFTATRTSSTPEMETAIAETVEACTDMSAARTGALIIFQRSVSLSSIMATGTIVNADVSAELLKNMFFNKAPLHDGAAIIRDARLAAAGCVLPLTAQTNLSKELGMRHRAGIGLSEQSDALVIIVSEETGAISVAIDGALKRHLTGARLDEILHQELIVQEASKGFWQRLADNMKGIVKGSANEE
ncbi:MAG: diadenylate cyclase CdaA [Oscillospiraceae bacterium]|jgi:TIGR00159 family protein|nr:diadenylate cyclase CdaA [Oscillospiraceae bacterium]